MLIISDNMRDMTPRHSLPKWRQPDRIVSLLTGMFCLILLSITWISIFPKWPKFYTNWAQGFHAVYLLIIALAPEQRRLPFLKWLLLFNLSTSLAVLLVFQIVFHRTSSSLQSSSVGFKLWAQIMHIVPFVGSMVLCWFHHALVRPMFPGSRIKQGLWWLWQVLGALLPKLLYLSLYNPQSVYKVKSVHLGIWAATSFLSILFSAACFFAFSFYKSRSATGGFHAARTPAAVCV